MRGDTVLAIEGICKVMGNSHDVKIIITKYSLEKRCYNSKSITIDRVHIPILVKLLEVANARGQI